MTAPAPADCRPALCHGILLVPTNGAVVFVGGGRRTMLGVPGDSDVFAQRLTLALDGRHTATAAAAVLDLRDEEFRQLLDALRGLGLLDATTRADGEVDPGTRFLSRSLGARFAIGSDEHMRRLTATTVALDGDLGGMSDMIREDLQAAGVGRVAPAATLSADELGGPRVLLVTDRYAAPTAQGTAARTKMVLHVALGLGAAWIGPLIVGSGGPCDRCLARSITEAEAEADDGVSATPVGGVGLQAVAAAHVVADVVRSFGVLGDAPRPSTMTRSTRSGSRHRPGWQLAPRTVRPAAPATRSEPCWPPTNRLCRHQRRSWPGQHEAPRTSCSGSTTSRLSA